MPDPAPVADGVFLVDKPAGVTSHDIVARVRRELGVGGGSRRSRSQGAGDSPRRIRVGHAGTLDPFATGLLLVLVGRATRVQRFLMALPKAYEVVAQFGAVSSTGDPEGEIVETGRVPAGELSLPVGPLRQRPPAFSAVKVGGRRAYALARAGETVELPARSVEVYRFEELWRDGSRRAFAVECSSGTYVRSLVAELGDAYCVSLRRTRIGPFDLADAGDALIPLPRALAFLPEVRLDPESAQRASHGRAVDWPPASGDIGAGELAEADYVRLTDSEGLIAVASVGPDRTLRPRVGLRG